MPESGARDGYHHGDLRGALCKHALRTIEASGVDALSLRDAARTLGVSPSAVYRHFADKAALVAVVVEDGLARMMHAMERAAHAAEQRAPIGHRERSALLAMGMSYVRFAAAHPTLFLAMIERPPAVMRAVERLLGRSVEGALSASSSAAQRRAVRRAVHAVIHGLAVMVAQGPAAGRDAATCDAAAREVLDIVLRGAAGG